MLIRSQDKKDLFKLDDMSICKKGDHIDITNDNTIVGYKGECHCIMGVYSTEEKAIKVLDMIQNAYAQYGTLVDGRGSVQGAFNLPKVFKMPQDSEV